MANKRLKKKIAKKREIQTPKAPSIKSKFRSMKQSKKINLNHADLSKSYERPIPEEWTSKIEKDKQYLKNMITNRLDEIPTEYLNAFEKALETVSETRLEEIIDFFGTSNEFNDWKEWYNANSEYEAGANTEDEKFGTLLSVLEALGVDINAI